MHSETIERPAVCTKSSKFRWTGKQMSDEEDESILLRLEENERKFRKSIDTIVAKASRGTPSLTAAVLASL